MRAAAKRGFALLLVAAATSTLGCAEPEDSALEEQDAMGATEAVDGATVPEFSEEVRTTFRPPEGAASDVRGTLRLLVPTQATEDAEDEPLVLHIEMAGLDPAEAYTAYVYGMPCDMEGDPLVPVGISPDDQREAPDLLQAEEDGTLEVELPVPDLRAMWVAAGNYSVRIFESVAMEEESLVACAVL